MKYFILLLATVTLAWPIYAQDGNFTLIVQASEPEVKIPKNHVSVTTKSGNPGSLTGVNAYDCKISGNQLRFQIPQADLPLTVQVAFSRSDEFSFEGFETFAIDGTMIRNGTCTVKLSLHKFVPMRQKFRLMAGGQKQPMADQEVFVMSSRKTEATAPTGKVVEYPRCIADTTDFVSSQTTNAEGDITITMWNDCNYSVKVPGQGGKGSTFELVPADGKLATIVVENHPVQVRCLVFVEDADGLRPPKRAEFESGKFQVHAANSSRILHAYSFLPNGEFTIEDLPPGRYILAPFYEVVEMRPYALISDGQFVIVEKADAPNEMKLVLRRRGQSPLKATFCDSKTGKPIGGATIRMALDGMAIAPGKTDDQGQYELDALWEGEYSVEISCVDGHTGQVKLNHVDKKPITVQVAFD